MSSRYYRTHKQYMKTYSAIYHRNGNKVEWSCTTCGKHFATGFVAQAHRKMLGHEISYQ